VFLRCTSKKSRHKEVIKIKELTELEMLKLALEHSISRNHKISLLERIAKLEGNSIEAKPIENKLKNTRKAKLDQQSFL
jgi:hypothetical protein